MTSLNVDGTLLASTPENSFLLPVIVVNNGLMTTTVTVLAVLTTYFLYIKSYREAVMRRSGSLKKLGYWNKWFGTIPSMVDIYKETPAKAHPHVHATMLYRKHKLDNVWFIDAWPAISEPQIVVADPAVAAQLVQAQNLTKHSVLAKFTGHLTGKLSLLTSDGALWRKTRSIFNPGFAQQHLMTLVPRMIDDALHFRQNLEQASSSGEMFFLENFAAMFAFDVMGHIVLDHDLECQLGPNELVESFRKLVEWTPEATDVNPFTNLNPTRYAMYFYYRWKMDNYLGRILDARYAHRSTLDRESLRGKRKPGIDLALDEYVRQQQEEGEKVMRGLDPGFRALAIDSMKTFLFAGSDSTSTTITYVFHSLAKHPEAYAKVKAELDAVFGQDITKAADLLREDSSLMNRLGYLNCVVKEVLRLFPPASTVRSGHPSVNFTYEGVTYPTAKAMVWISNHTIHRRPELFPEPDSFIPERFLPAEDPERFQEVPKDAWRPFEKGPRNCIGQELAMLEIKIAIALTIREFEVRDAYKEYDEKMGRPNPGGIEGGTRGMYGDRAYQVLQASAKPVDAYPAFVTKRTTSQ